MMHHVSSRTLVFTAFLIALSLLLPESVYTAEQWPQFRGPAMNAAVEDNPNLPDQWSTTDNVEWSAAIPGLGRSISEMSDHEKNQLKETRNEGEV